MLAPFAVKPTVAVAPGASVPSYEAFVTVTLLPDCVSVPFQRLVIAWLPGNVQPSFQLLIVAELVFLTTTCPWKPPCQLPVTEYVPEQVPGG